MFKRVLLLASLLFFVCASSMAATLTAAIGTIQTTNACTYSTFTFNDASTYSGSNKSKLKYKWYFNGVNTATDTGKTLKKVFTATGSYTVSLVVTNTTDVPNLKDSTSKSFTINFKGVNPSFTVTGNRCQRVELAIKNTSVIPSGPTVYWNWTFGDNQTSTSDQPNIHVYPTDGSYTITMKDSTSDGCLSSSSQVITILKTPQAKASTTQHCVDSATTFDASSTVTNGLNVSYSWTFQDNTVQTGIKTTKIFNVDKTYSVKLGVTNNTNGCNDTLVVPFTVYSKPQVKFGYIPVCQDSIALFFDSTYIPYGPSAASWSWDFRDSLDRSDGSPAYYSSATVPDTVKHGFLHGGIWHIALTVVTKAGCIDSGKQSIFVNPLPNTNFTFKNTCQEYPVQFTDATSIPGATAANKQKVVAWLWYFGDSISKNKPYTSTSQSPSHQYANPGYKYKVKLITTSNTGCKDSVTKTVIAYPSPTSKFAYTTGKCQNDLITFSNNSSISLAAQQHADSLTHYLWLFGDGKKDSLENTYHAYKDSGYIPTRFVAYSAYGCTDTSTQQVYVVPLPRPSFTWTGSCERDSIQFNNTSASAYGTYLNDSSYDWDFGDTSVAHGVKNPKHYFRYSGTFNVHLTVTSKPYGCSKDTFIKVTIIPGPHSSFTWASSCLGQPVIYTNTTSSKDPRQIKYRWDFGDKTSDTVTNPIHVYNSVVNLHVKLVSTMPATGCRDSVTNFVPIAPLPKAKFWTKNTCSDSDVVFIDSSTIPANYYFKSYDFDFGDGQKGSGAKITHRYTLPGTYVVKEVVTSTTNCQDSFTRMVTVYKKPKVDFTDNVQCAGLATQFTDLTPASDSVSIWKWAFNGRDTSLVQNPSYTYHNADYPASAFLKVETAHGCSDQTTKGVTILLQPEPNFSVLSGCNNRPFSFQGFNKATSVSVTDYDWDFGDDTTTSQTSGRNVTHTFYKFGTFKVALKEVSNQGCNGYDTVKVVVTPLPIPNFTYTGSCFGEKFQFFDSSQYSDALKVWDFGDNNSSTDADPIHPYAAPGTYLVKLAALNNVGCTPDTAYKYIVVHPLPLARIYWDTACFGNPSPLIDSSLAQGGHIDTRQWKLPHGLRDSVAQPYYVYPDTFKGLEDSFQVSLKVGTNFGCSSSVTKEVHVKQRPVTSFIANPDPVTIQHPEVTFTNTTLYADPKQFYWNFGDGYDSHDVNPVHSYNDTGTYVVTLSSMSSRGCPDTLRYTLYVTPGYSIYAPNAMTVNGDGVNDEWRAQGVGVIDYDVVIIDNWGQVVFHSTDMNETWKGEYMSSGHNNSGTKVPEGVYFYYIKAGNFANTDFTTLKGNITLMR